MDRKYFQLEGRISLVTESSEIKKKNGKTFSKRTINVETEDQQVVFFESRINLEIDWEIGKKVKVLYYFCGSIKGDKMYNNVVAANITSNE